MGGLIAVKSKKGVNAIEASLEGLKRMEFRGRDSSGLAFLIQDKIEVIKDAVPVDVLSKSYDLSSFKSDVVLGHTRYSTHGKADKVNAHPHIDCRGSVAVVGDGALINYEDLLTKLLSENHLVRSKCDFEVVPHLIEFLTVSEGSSLLKATLDAFKFLRGVFSLAALLSDGHIVAYTSKQPLYVGEGNEFISIASTKSGLYGIAEVYTTLEDGEVLLLTPGGDMKFVDSEGRTVFKVFKPLDLSPSLVSTDGYPHHMLREVYEIPYAILRTYSSVQRKYLELVGRVLAQSDNVYVVANGTSLHAGMIFAYYLSELAGKVPIVISAAEFPYYYVDKVKVGDAVIAVSQSGETKDVLKSAYEARLHGATVVGLTNNINSRLTRFSNIYLPIGAGPEISVPATKTFTSTVVLLYMVALATALASKTLSSEALDKVFEDLSNLSSTLLSVIDKLNAVAKEKAKLIAGKRSGYVVSRGLTYPLALEAALKIKEASYIHAEGVQGGELRHGPISILDKDMFTIFIEPLEEDAARDIHKLASEVLDYGASTLLIRSEGLVDVKEVNLEVIEVPKSSNKHLAVIPLSLAAQLLSYWIANYVGSPIDKPRRLFKVVSN